MNTRFHAGELQAQALAGVHASDGAIRDHMPQQHRDFFAALPFILAATVGDDGAPRAQVWSGAPGFVDSPDAATLRLAVPRSGMRQGAPLGLLGLDFATRRRNRANGVVAHQDDAGLTLTVRESFGNCPQHIRRRQARAVAAQSHAQVVSDVLDAQMRALIERADTCFVATSGGVHGVDISHRGGPAGFVRIDGEQLVIPDYSGNRYFNTFGNLLIDPRAALLFIDFEQGDVLELQGSCAISWDREGATPGEAGGREWRFTVSRGTFQRAAVALRWDPIDPA